MQSVEMSLMHSVRNHLKKNFKEFQNKYPQVIQVDPIECQEKLTSRPKMLELFYHVTSKIKELHVPQSLVLKENERLPGDFPFPVICKTLEATGAITSHQMAIVWDEAGLEEFRRPILVQQLINHSSTIFKIFAIGDYSYIVKRPSIRNFYPDESNGKPVHFNSQKFKKLEGEPTAPLPDESLIEKLIKCLTDDLGLTLIGLDLITCSATGRHYIIDANYFPGYTGVEDCPQKFLNLVMHKLKVA